MKKKHMRKASCARYTADLVFAPTLACWKDLHLSRTMLTALWTAYVDRFACDWPRLTTTDPYFNIINYKLYLCLYLYYLQIIQTYVFINITVVRIKNASLNFNV